MSVDFTSPLRHRIPRFGGLRLQWVSSSSGRRPPHSSPKWKAADDVEVRIITPPSVLWDACVRCFIKTWPARSGTISMQSVPGLFVLELAAEVRIVFRVIVTIYAHGRQTVPFIPDCLIPSPAPFIFDCGGRRLIYMYQRSSEEISSCTPS